MSKPKLVQPERLARGKDRDEHTLFDCRFSLQEPGQGRRDWLAGHIPGAVYADLDRDLAGPVTPSSGRHPLPATSVFAAFLAGAGWAPGREIIAYDAQGGAFAARLWWLMRYFGHDCVNLLDGGWKAWRALGGAVSTGEERPEAEATEQLTPHPEMVLDAERLASGLGDNSCLLLDARDAARFAGRQETIDPIAGHVPGARNRPFSANLDASSRFLAPSALRREFTSAMGDRPATEVVHMCGSGVTACHNLWAMERAGLSGSRLYPGSWSEWIRDPERGVATGEPG